MIHALREKLERWAYDSAGGSQLKGRIEMLDLLWPYMAQLTLECCCPGERHHTPPYDFILCDPCEALKALEEKL